MIIRFLLAIFFAATLSVQAQTTTPTLANATPSAKKHKMHGSFYLTWGYNRDDYSISNIHFIDHTGDNYDFTLYNAAAHDKPDLSDFFKRQLTVPQYVFNIGYFFNNKDDLGIEISWDHLKYVVIDNQELHLQGTIRGKYYNVDTLVTPNFIHLQHTNGNNYLMTSIVKRYVAVKTRKDLFKLSGLLKFGAGALVPRTSSTVLGNTLAGPFKLSGVVVGAAGGIRVDFLRFFFLDTSGKLALPDYLTDKLPDGGVEHQRFFSLEWIFSGGFNLPLSLFEKKAE